MRQQAGDAAPLVQRVRFRLQVLAHEALVAHSSRGGDRPAFYGAVTSLEQAIHAANPATQVYLYQTWARADLTYPSGAPYAGLPINSMTLDLHRGYAQAPPRLGT